MKLPRRLRTTVWMLRRPDSRPNAAVLYLDSGGVCINTVGIGVTVDMHREATIIMGYRDAILLHRRLGEAIAARRQA